MKGMDHHARPPVATWVRLALVALGVPNVLTGAWAVLRPEQWFDRFPGWDPRLVAGEPPFNAHLATDAGSGFLATGIVVLIAAWLADRRTVQVALVTYGAFALPHALFHAINPAPELTDAENLQSVTSVVFTAVVTIGLLAVVSRPSRELSSPPQPQEMPA